MNIFLSNSTTVFAGAEDYVFILAKYLRQRGHHVWVSANPRHLLLRKCTNEGISTIPVSYTGMSRVFRVASEVRTHLQQLSIDIIHSNANYDRTVAGIAAAWTNTPHVASVHSGHSIQRNITHWLRNRFWIDHFIAVAESVKQVLVSKDRIRADRITVIPNGVESSPRELEAERRRKARAALGATSETCVIGNVARLVHFKGHRYLLEAIARVVKVNSSLLCVILGDGELMSTLQQQTHALDLDSYVRFLGFQEDPLEWYPAFDIYCHSSLELQEEAFPLAILKALAAGLPVVATKVGGIGAMVEEGVSGYLTQPEDPPALANALLHVMSDAQLRRSMGAASLVLFTRNFHAAMMAERVEQVYTQVMQR